MDSGEPGLEDFEEAATRSPQGRSSVSPVKGEEVEAEVHGQAQRHDIGVRPQPGPKQLDGHEAHVLETNP